MLLPVRNQIPPLHYQKNNDSGGVWPSVVVLSECEMFEASLGGTI